MALALCMQPWANGSWSCQAETSLVRFATHNSNCCSRDAAAIYSNFLISQEKCTHSILSKTSIRALSMSFYRHCKLSFRPHQVDSCQASRLAVSILSNLTNICMPSLPIYILRGQTMKKRRNALTTLPFVAVILA